MYDYRAQPVGNTLARMVDTAQSAASASADHRERSIRKLTPIIGRNKLHCSLVQCDSLVRKWVSDGRCACSALMPRVCMAAPSRGRESTRGAPGASLERGELEQHPLRRAVGARVLHRLHDVLHGTA